jgi:hypothetical protein
MPLVKSFFSVVNGLLHAANVDSLLRYSAFNCAILFGCHGRSRLINLHGQRYVASQLLTIGWKP